MNPIEELADLHATLSAHTNCATDGRNWRLMWQRLCEQRQEAIRNAFDDGMRKAVNSVCEKCGRGFSPLYRTECLQRWGKLPKCCATCALENLDAFLSEPDPDEMPPDKREQPRQAVGGDAEGKVPTAALDEQRVSREAIRPPGSGVDELEYWRGNAMHYHGLCVALEDEIDNYSLALDGKNACIRRRDEWLKEARERLELAEGAVKEWRECESIRNGDLVTALEKAEQDKCGLAADALNARQLLREFMAYVKCGQVPEDAHCARQAKRLLASELLDARAREGGGGGGSENHPPAEEKYNVEVSDRAGDGARS